MGVPARAWPFCSAKGRGGEVRRGSLLGPGERRRYPATQSATRNPALRPPLVYLRARMRMRAACLPRKARLSRQPSQASRRMRRSRGSTAYRGSGVRGRAAPPAIAWRRLLPATTRLRLRVRKRIRPTSRAAATKYTTGATMATPSRWNQRVHSEARDLPGPA